MAYFGDPGCTLEDLALPPLGDDYYRKLGFITPEERKVRDEKHNAFWKQKDALSQLALPEEDLPLQHRGRPNRHFKSKNIVDLVPWLKRARKG